MTEAISAVSAARSAYRRAVLVYRALPGECEGTPEYQAAEEKMGLAYDDLRDAQDALRELQRSLRAAV